MKTLTLLRHAKSSWNDPIERDFDRDRFMSAEEAKAYGIIDNIIDNPNELVEESKQPSVTA